MVVVVVVEEEDEDACLLMIGTIGFIDEGFTVIPFDSEDEEEPAATEEEEDEGDSAIPLRTTIPSLPLPLALLAK